MQTLLLDGRMKDLSGHANHGTLFGTTSIAGKVGQARHFNAGDRITASSIPVPATDFTVAAWFRWTTNPSPYYSGIQGGGGSWELRVMADRKSTRLNSRHSQMSYAVFCLKKKKANLQPGGLLRWHPWRLFRFRPKRPPHYRRPRGSLSRRHSPHHRVALDSRRERRSVLN